MGELGFVVHNLPTVGDVTTLGVVGPITSATTHALRDAVRTAIRACPNLHLRLDLCCCTSVDLDGLFALAVAQQDARAHGGDLYLLNVPPLVAHQLQQHNFDGLLLPARPS
jgi:anti-anti-sigma regulatory factor